MTRLRASLIPRIEAFFFPDRVRVIELLSAFSLIAWAMLFAAHPDVLDRSINTSFRALGANTWVAITGMVGLGQVAAVLFALSVRPHARIVVMALASGVWFAIGSGVASSGEPDIAPAISFLLSLLCALSGGYLGWTPRR